MTMYFADKKVKRKMFGKSFFEFSLEDVFYYEMFNLYTFMSTDIERILFPGITKRKLYEIEEIIEIEEQKKFDKKMLKWIQKDTLEEKIKKLEKSISGLIKSERQNKKVKFAI